MEWSPVPLAHRGIITAKASFGELLYTRTDLDKLTAVAHPTGARRHQCGHGEVETWCVHNKDVEGQSVTTRHTSFQAANEQAVKHSVEFRPDRIWSPFVGREWEELPRPEPALTRPKPAPTPSCRPDRSAQPTPDGGPMLRQPPEPSLRERLRLLVTRWRLRA